MNFIKQIFEGKWDDLDVHNQFIRFGKGQYERASININNSKTLKIKTGFEFGNDFIRLIAKSGEGPFKVKGMIFSKDSYDINFVKEYKKSKGFYTGKVDTELTNDELLKLYEQFKLEYLLLTIDGKNITLKIKAKPHNPRGSYANNFCQFSTTNEKLKKDALEEFAFDLGDFKKANLKHIFIIDEVTYPKEKEGDFEWIRVNSKRKGIIKRLIEEDTKELEKETEFES